MEIPAFDLVTSRTDGAAVVMVIGELDLSTAPRLREMLVELADSGTMDVTLDLAAMSFIDSTGVSVLVSGLKRQREMGGDLTLQSPRASAMKVLEITGLTSVFTIHSEAASATTSNGTHEAHPGDTLKSEVASSRTSPSRA
jgi:anti-sigma B factor antagonist